MASYRGHIEKRLAPFFGDRVLLSEIDAAMVRSFVADKAGATNDDGKPRWSATTIRNVLVTLRMLLDAAVEDGHLAVNPAAKVKPPKRERPERQIVSDDELGRVLDVAGDPWRTIFDVLSWTALRRGELLAARWGDVDLASGRLHVRRSRGRYGEGAPKSRAGSRVVPLTPALVAALRRHRLAQRPSDDDYMFRTRNGTPIDGDNLTRAWTNALRKAGVRHVALHSLRHLAASRMIACGASIKTVQTVVGHSSVQLTLDVYAHMLPDDLDNLAALMAARDPRCDPSGAISEHLDAPESTNIENDEDAENVVAIRIPA